MMLLEDEEWSKWSGYEIAKRCCVSHTFVDNIKNSLATVASEKQELPNNATYINKHGQVSTMNTSNIGKLQNNNFTITGKDVEVFNHALANADDNKEVLERSKELASTIKPYTEPEVYEADIVEGATPFDMETKKTNDTISYFSINNPLAILCYV